MTVEEARRLLDTIAVIRHPCDLDLLLFFARHSRALITSEQLARWLGYDLKQVADSLEVLLDAGLLTRTQNPAHVARMYVFTIRTTQGGWLRALLDAACTRQGRLAVRRELRRRSQVDTIGAADRARGSAAALRRHTLVVREKSDAKMKTG